MCKDRGRMRALAEPFCPRDDIARLLESPRYRSAGHPAAALIDDQARVTILHEPLRAIQHTLAVTRAAVNEDYCASIALMWREEPCPQHNVVGSTGRHLFPGGIPMAGNFLRAPRLDGIPLSCEVLVDRHRPRGHECE